MQHLNRIQPALNPGAYKSYSMQTPLATHFRPGSCEEVRCRNYQNGWITSIDEGTPLGQKQAHYIRHDASRKHVESHEAGVTHFTFEAGQTCFKQHLTRREIHPNFVVSGGDHRGNPLGTPTRVLSSEDWVDDFANHQEKIKHEIEKG